MMMKSTIILIENFNESGVKIAPLSIKKYIKKTSPSGLKGS